EFLGDRVDQRFHRTRLVDVELAAMAALARQALADGLRAGIAGGGADHGGAARGQLVGDGRADATAGAGNQCDLAAQGQVAHVDRLVRMRWWPSRPRGIQRQSARAASKSAAAPMARASSDLSMRLTRPARTLPGPHSAMRVAPREASACTQPVQRTGR